jgi:hypothetical protein
MAFIQTEQVAAGAFFQLQLVGGAPLTCMAREFPNAEAILPVPDMTPGTMIEIGMPPDERFVGHTAVMAAFVGFPLPQLGLCGCWVGAGGVVYVRMIAGTGGVAAGNVRVGVLALL